MSTMLDKILRLQQAIEHHCNGAFIPRAIAESCPYHAFLLDDCLHARRAQPMNKADRWRAYAAACLQRDALPEDEPRIMENVVEGAAAYADAMLAAEDRRFERSDNGSTNT